jgi:uncharacterized protein YbjT (DUF2867 family)
MTRILIAGATGMIGAAALKLLLADASVTQVVAPTRRVLAPHAKLLNPITTIADLPHDAAWWAVDGALCAIGTTRALTPDPAAYRVIDHDYPLAIARLVRARGAARFSLVSSAGADARSCFTYTRLKGEVEDGIEALGFASLTIAQPGMLGGNRTEHRPAEKRWLALLGALAPILPAAARINPASTVAKLLVEAAISGAPGKHIITSADIVRASG